MGELSTKSSKIAPGERAIAEPTAAEYVVKNRLRADDEPIHNWYRFVLGYPPHLVREYLEALGADPERDWVLDPFSGTATTPLEARLRGFRSLSCDANPISMLATRVKLGWDMDVAEAEAKAEEAPSLAESCLAGGFDPEALLPPSASALIPEGFISHKPLVRVTALRHAVETLAAPGAVRDFLLLALANTIVSTAGNVGFGPEVYRLPPKDDADVSGAFARTVAGMVDDLRAVLESRPRRSTTTGLDLEENLLVLRRPRGRKGRVAIENSGEETRQWEGN